MDPFFFQPVNCCSATPSCICVHLQKKVRVFATSLCFVLTTNDLLALGNNTRQYLTFSISKSLIANLS